MQTSDTVYIIDPAQHDCRPVQDAAAAMQVSCQWYSSAEQFLHSYQDGWPGCVVSELRLLGNNGLELQQEMDRRGIRLPLIFHSRHAETRLTVAAMRAGAVTVLDKPASPQELWDALFLALSLDRDRRRSSRQSLELRQRLNELTAKEKRVLELILDGLPNKTIARRLDVSVRTVEARRAQIFRKTSTHSVAELVRLTMEADSPPPAVTRPSDPLRRNGIRFEATRPNLGLVGCQ